MNRTILLASAALALCVLGGCMDVPDEPPGGPVAIPAACTNAGGACGRGAQLCCPGTICKGGACRSDGSCSQTNQACNSSYDCCGTLTCSKNGVCTGLLPQGAGTPCQGHSDCASTLTCQNGICRGP